MQKTSLLDGIDINTIQKFQNSISKIAGLDAILLDKDGIGLTVISKNDSGVSKELAQELVIKLTDSYEERIKNFKLLGNFSLNNIEVYNYEDIILIYKKNIYVSNEFVATLYCGHAVDFSNEEKISRIINEKIELISEICQCICDLLLSVIRRQYGIAAIKNKAESQMTFIDTMQEDLKNHTMAIVGCARKAIESNDSAAMSEALKRIIADSHRTLSTINDTIEFTKVYDGQFELNESTYSIFQMLDILCMSAAKRNAIKGVVINKEYQEDMPEYYLGDAGRISQVVNRLLEVLISYYNSRKILINAGFEKKGYAMTLIIKICAKDIHKEDISVFMIDEYLNYRGVEADTDMDESKLLYLTGQVIKRMSGTVEAVYEDGNGLCFNVLLPQLVINEQELPG